LKKQVLEATKVVEDVVKSKDEVIRNKQEETDAMRLKYEKERVKQLEDSLFTLQKLISEKSAAPVPLPVPTPANELIAEKPKYKRPSRAKSAVAERVVETQSITKQPQQIIPKKSVDARITRPATETLIDKSYSEQLQERLRTQAINRIMSDTFGGF
jgi:glucan-binding YG repeat protein